MKSKFRLPTSLFATIVAGTALVIYWRGIWGLLDVYLLPENPALSFAISAVVGLALLFAVHKLDSLD